MAEPVKSKGALIEIIERGGPDVDAPDNYGAIIPNDVRINGQSLLIPAGEKITVHNIEINGERDAVKVTLTLFARRVSIHSEPGDG